MKPRELIKECLKKEIEPALSELDFKFSKSGLKFQRKNVEFLQVITTHLNRYNRENLSAEFYFSFSVTSPKYSQWYLLEYNRKPSNNALAGEMYWNLEGWKHPRPDIASEKNRKKKMQLLLEDILSIGLPFLEKYSDWENAADLLLEKNWLHDKACDFYLIAGKRSKAQKALNKGLKYWEKQFHSNSFNCDVNEITLRLRKHFDENTKIRN